MPLASARVPSMADVAALAGVSHQTVSRVLNEHPNVRDQTRLRVMAAIQELGYRPNQAARALARGHSDLIGIVAQVSTLYGPTAMRTSIEESAAELGYGVSVSSVRNLDQQSLTKAVNRSLDQRASGIVLIAPVQAALVAIEAIPRGFPLILVDGDRTQPTPSVSVDQVKGAMVATQHLLDAGHSTVWHVSGPSEIFDARDRIEGWRTALVSAGAEVPPLITGDWSPQSGFDAGQMLARVPAATAVFAGNDQMALGIISALRTHGIRVPQDVSIVGFDDLPESAFYDPPLTTVRQDFIEVAHRALGYLISQIDGNGLPQPDAVAPELVVRSSVAPPRA